MPTLHLAPAPAFMYCYSLSLLLYTFLLTLTVVTIWVFKVDSSAHPLLHFLIITLPSLIP